MIYGRIRNADILFYDNLWYTGFYHSIFHTVDDIDSISSTVER